MMQKNIEKLLEQGISKDEIVKEYILKEGIENHDKGDCNCDLTDGGYGFCYAEQFMSGSVTADDVIDDLSIAAKKQFLRGGKMDKKEIMDEINSKKNIKIGLKVVANVGLNKNWVRYTEGNNGEKDYYRDVYSYDNRLLYCDGETCIVQGVNEFAETVTLLNELENEVFTIPYNQFIEDFYMVVNRN